LSGVEHSNDVRMDVSIGNYTQTKYLADARPQVTFDKDKGTVTGDLDTSSFIDNGIYNTKPLELETIFDGENKTLKVDIELDASWTITYDPNGSYDTKILSRLFILVPLDLKVDKVPEDAPDNIKEKYVMLDFGDILNKKSPDGETDGETGSKTGGDLFGRKPDGDNALKDITYMDIGLKFSPSDINIIDPNKLAVLVTTNDGGRLLQFKEKNPSLRFEGNTLNNIPFSPNFSVLLEKDENKTFGSFKILRQNNQVKPKFDFKLYVEAKAALVYTMEL